MEDNVGPIEEAEVFVLTVSYHGSQDELANLITESPDIPFRLIGFGSLSDKGSTPNTVDRNRELIKGLELAIQLLNSQPSFRTNIQDPRPGYEHRNRSSYAVIGDLERLIKGSK